MTTTPDPDQHLPADTPIVLFDGVCNLCNGWVRFIINHDTDGDIRFAPLQSAIGQALIRAIGEDTSSIDSIVVIHKRTAYTRTRAIGHILTHLDGHWPLFGSVLSIVPTILADSVYRLIARIRYTVFGKRNTCMIPTDETKDRFLEGSTELR